MLQWSDPASAVWIGRIFFVWVSIFNLFVISVFWQMNVDLFSSEQGKRLFGIIAAGATHRRHRRLQRDRLAGAIRVADGADARLGGLLEVAVFSVGRLSRLSPTLHHRAGGGGR